MAGRSHDLVVDTDHCGARGPRWGCLTVVFGTIGVATGPVAQKYRGPDGTVKIQLGDRNMRPAPQKTRLFFDQRMLFWKGEFYTRADVIKMHANALGGVHLDFRKAQHEAHINDIKNYFGFEVKGTNNQMLIGEDIARGRADPQRRESIYDATELIAMDTARIFCKRDTWFSEGVRRSTDAVTRQAGDVAAGDS